jgi:hypothetical protein
MTLIVIVIIVVVIVIVVLSSFSAEDHNYVKLARTEGVRLGARLVGIGVD